MRTRFAQVHGSCGDILREVARDLARGAIVGVPTECVYGLAASADHAAALGRLFEVKGRPEHRPVARLLADATDLDAEVDVLPPLARRLRDRIWPGPLTLVLRDRSGELTGYRNPDHGAPRGLAAAAGVRIVLTSANRSGEPDAVDAAQVRRDFEGRIEWILDGGPSPLGRPSTVVRVDDDRWEILREGALDRDAVADGACVRVLFVCTGNLCRSPMAEGLLRRLLADRLGCPDDPVALEDRGYRVGSAGTGGMPDCHATPEAVRASAELGVDLAGHRSQPVTPSLVDAADHVVAMTGHHLRSLALLTGDRPERFRLLDPAGEDIPDPYLQPIETYRAAAARIRALLESLVEELT